MKVEIIPVLVGERAAFKRKGDAIEVQPLFWKTSSIAVVGTVIVRAEDGTVLFTGVLRVNGQSGRASLMTRGVAPVRPAADGKVSENGK